jgi:hypothetical protein
MSSSKPTLGGFDMTILEALQLVQFVTVDGRRLAVLNAEEAAGGNRQAAGWLHWDDIREELE